ncbi:LuxR C-terminal-related transcriptional regulator [Dactylosporangium sp. CA-233914]|uniref:helix-turn-helix transcriptional regulator n=1 Tax=Dactylosporangium sp. CA-233914 TaxID=3239934 RepID=UPI003D8A7BDD
MALDDLPLVADMCELPLAAAAREFDVLVEASLIAATPDADGYVMSVPWLADALYASLGPASRDRIHRSAADTLCSRPVVHHERVAHHLLRLSSTTDEAQIARLVTAAGHLTARSPEMAVKCYRRILSHVNGPPERVAELTARLARANLLAGRPEETVDVGRALLNAPGAGSSEAYPWLLPVVTEAMKATSAVEEAETILRTDTEGIDELRDAQAAYLFAVSGRDAEARRRVQRVRGSLAKHSIRGQVNMLGSLLHAQCIAGDFDGLRDDAALLTGIIDQAPDEVRLHAWATLAHVRSVEGDLTASARAASKAEALLRGDAWGIYVPGVQYARAAVGFADGHWDEALRIAEQADAPLAQSGNASYLHLMRHIRTRILANRGEFADALRVAAAPVPAPQFVRAMRTLALAEIEILEGSAGAGAERLKAALGEEGLPGEVRAGLLSMLSSAAVAQGDEATAWDCFGEVDQRSGVAAASRQVRLETRLALARVEASGEMAQEVLREAVDHGFRLFEGRALLTLGCLDIDPETNLTQAMKVFGELNALPWRRSAAIELREHGFRVPRRPRTRTDALTETDIQLARLVQAARSNKEIADVMSLSVKTVEVYLSRLYVKAGCKNRLDLARAADEGRLAID